MCNMGGSCNPSSDFKKDERKLCRNCKFIRCEKSKMEMVCAINKIKGLKDTVNSLPPLEICSAYELKAERETLMIQG